MAETEDRTMGERDGRDTSMLVVDVVDPAGDDAVAAVTAYFDELDDTFPTGFDPGDGWHVDARNLRPPHGAFVVLRDPDGAVAACGGVQRIDDTTAEIKRMWVAQGWRGGGVGRRMLADLEATAARLGYRRVVLDTNASLTPAIRMYTTAGYEPIERYNDNPYAQHWFARQLPSPSADG